MRVLRNRCRVIGDRARVGLAGGFGYGEAHRKNLARLHAAGRADLVGIADPAGPDADQPGAGQSCDGTVWYPSLEDLLAEQACDVVIVATPTHTHADLAELAMRSGAAVYLEKPPAPSLQLYERLLAVSRDTRATVPGRLPGAGVSRARTDRRLVRDVPG